MMARNKPRVVVFLGAGYSVVAGIPTMRSFVDRLRDSEVLDADLARDFDAILLHCASLASLMGESVRNLEHIASFLSALRLANPDFRFPGCKVAQTATQAEALLLDSIRRVARPDLVTHSLSNYTRLSDSFSRSEMTIVTTNYDLVAELSCWLNPDPSTRTRLRLIDGFRVSEQPPRSSDLFLYASPDDTQCPLLIKLHGSVNWFRRGEEIQVLDRLRPWKDSSGNVPASAGRPAHWELENPQLTRDPLVGDELAMVSPNVVKHSSHLPVMRAQWEAASRAIAMADQIWFIGYSFPPSDSYMRYFLAASLSSNIRIRRIAVIDPDPEVVFDRVPSLFADPRFVEILEAIPFPWLEVPFDKILNQGLAGWDLGESSIKQLELQARRRAVFQGRALRQLEEDAPSGRGLRGRGRGRGRW